MSNLVVSEAIDTLDESEEMIINSIDLVKMINECRAKEGKIKAEKQHFHLMRDIREEIDALSTAGINQSNFGLVEYVDSKGQKRPCFAMNIDGAIQMLMKESPVVRYLVTEKLKELKEEAKALNTIIDNSTDEQAKLERDKLRFSNRKTASTIYNCDILELPKLIEDLERYIINLDTAKRISRYNSAIYAIGKIKDKISKNNIHLLPLVQEEEKKIICNKAKLQNRINGGIKSNKTKKINELLQIANCDNKVFTQLDAHGFSNNYMYTTKYGLTTKTDSYNKWINNFPYHQFMDKKEFSSKIDTSKPMKLTIRYVCKKEFDHHNFNKSFIDVLSNYYGFDDSYIMKVDSELIDFCSGYDTGKIFYCLEQL